VKLKTFLVCFAAVTLLILVRYVLTGTLIYIFILWNIILAAAPLWVESLMRSATRKWKGWIAGGVSLILGGAWLMLLPNAFYILTDFTHQNNDVVVNMRDDGYFGGIYYSRGDAMYVYDSLLILTATIVGAYFGGLALLHAYTFFRKHLSKSVAYGILGGIMVLSGIGVYIGRYGRWNSWDVLYRPLHILTDFLYQFVSAGSKERMVVTVFTMVLFQGLSLYAAYWIQSRQYKLNTSPPKS